MNRTKCTYITYCTGYKAYTEAAREFAGQQIMIRAMGQLADTV